MPWITDLWALAKKVDSLFELEQKHGRAIADLQVLVGNLEKRVARLEHREDIVVSEAKSAARAGAMDAMSGQMLEIGGRLAKLESGTLQVGEASRPDPAVKRVSKKKN